MINYKIIYIFLFASLIASCADNQSPIISNDGRGSVDSQKHACNRDFATRMLLITSPNTGGWSSFENENEKNVIFATFISMYQDCMSRVH